MDRPVLISSEALDMLLASSGAFFTMALKSKREGRPQAPTIDDLKALQLAIIEAVGVLGQQTSPTLQKIMREQI